jgi:type IV secretory pathway VirJ component
VVGLKSLEYFWTKRTPEGMAKDIDTVLRQYLASWKKERIVLIGYSRGADVLPFMVSRLAPDLQRRIRLVALLGPSRTVEFEFHVSDWWRDSASGVPTAPEVAKLKALHVLCMYGSEEADSLCRSLGGGLFVTHELRGAHHFDGDFVSLANRIMEELK